ncbi:AMP-binding protein [Streptomyces sp. NPDC059070]|uniref:AMP-binding protein n=1 Tax=Streptomyces sp. NPDC059070 TaxID=3346713 RepID=UPI0036777598
MTGSANIAALLHRTAGARPDAPAVCEGAAVLRDYRQLAGRARAVGAALRHTYGLAPGDRVALAMRNTPCYPEVLFGVWWAGLVATPMNARLHPKEFAQQIDDCGARVCVATGELAGALREQGLGATVLTTVETLVRRAGQVPAGPPAEVRPGDPAWLFYTSGTTGRPKGATLTHRNVAAATECALTDIGPGIDAAFLHIAPLSHAGGLFGLATVARGRPQVFPRDGVVDAHTLDEALRAFGPAVFFAVPTMLRRLLDPALLPDGLLDRVHHVLYGGAPMYTADLRAAVARFGAERLWQGYGQGETPATITHLRPEDHTGTYDEALGRRLASVGRVRTGVEVRIVDADGVPVPPGTTGEVTVRGETVMAGYWNDPGATARALRGGWLHTGDLGRFDVDGYLTLVDRAKDLIIAGGSNIYPREVEEALLRHPAVAEAAVVGAPDPEWGELPVAFVVAVDGCPVTAAELEGHCLGELGRFKRPRAYRFVPALPKNSYGKVLKTELTGPIRPVPDAERERG